MGLKSEVGRLYTFKLSPSAVRQISLPAAAAQTLAVSGITPLWGNWTDVELAAAVLLPTLVIGFCVSTPLVEVWDIGIGLCTTVQVNAAGIVGPGPIAAAARSAVRFEFITVATGLTVPIMLPVPVFYNAGEGIIARSGTVGGGDAIDITVFAVTGF